MRTNLRQIESYAKKNLAIELKRQADYYNKNNLQRKLDVGDQVLVRETRNSEKCKKYKFHGPYTIQKKLGEWTYELLDIDSGQIFRRSYNQVKKFYRLIREEEEMVTEREDKCSIGRVHGDVNQNIDCRQQQSMVECNQQPPIINEFSPRSDANSPECVPREERSSIVGVRRSTRVKRKTKRFGYDG